MEFDFRTAKSRDIHITDTTFRDGQQARPPYTIEQMVNGWRNGFEEPKGTQHHESLGREVL